MIARLSNRTKPTAKWRILALLPLLSMAIAVPSGCHHFGVAHRLAPERINAERPLGPYCGAVRVGHTLYLSGQIGLDPETGKLVDGGIEAETHQVIQNLTRVLDQAGYETTDVVRATVFLTDVKDYGAMNKVYAQHFGDSPPSRACVEVSGLVRNARVEISCIAVR